MLTDLQQRAAHAIVNVFETGSPRGDYGKVTILRGDSGHLTYGRSQTTLARHGDAGTIGERTWIEYYVSERGDWLANHFNTLLRRTVYRMAAFQQLMTVRKWELELPLKVRGVRIDEEVLLAAEPIRVSAEDHDERTLLLVTPRLKGDDVRALQQGLVKAGTEVIQDGVFAPATEKAVKRFQKLQGLKVDGVVGPVTRSALGQ